MYKRQQQRFARDAKALQMHLMADAVARAGKIDAMLISNRADKFMVVGVFKAGLKHIMVDIRN